MGLFKQRSIVSLGFTGTQEGMTRKQRHAVLELIRAIEPDEAHHGDCIGADKDFHHLMEGFEDVKIYVHPPLCDDKRAFCEGIILPAKDYLVRNQDIVRASTVLIATPKEYEEQVRSGTWATARYAWKANKPIHIVLPDGRFLVMEIS